MIESKKLALLRILQILEKYSDCDHPLTQEQISEHLVREYGIEIERKAIGRNLSLLKEAGFEIDFTNKKGSYLVCREFDDAELRLLIDSVLASRHITAKHSKELIEKLRGLSNVHFSAHTNFIHSANQWNKTDNNTLFYSISLIDEAIGQGRQVSFSYNKYGQDRKLHRTSKPRVSPYQLILHNQRYYLMAYNGWFKHMAFYRLDRITDMKILEDAATPLKSLEGYENGIDYRELSTALPYLFHDPIERVEFYADKDIVDQIIDWFGENARFEQVEGRLKVTVYASPTAMEYWSMQYLNYVEVVAPTKLREKIAENVSRAHEKYNP